MSKVFKMNDFDWVFADNEQQAKEFYQNETGENIQDINEDFEGEVNLESEMFYRVNELPFEEQKDEQLMQYIHGELHVKRSFKWLVEVAEKENLKSPCLIASTES